MNTKKCFKCNVQWPLIFFYKHNGMKDGHLNKCKKCSKKDVKENMLKKYEYYKSYDLKRNLNKERREKNILYSRNYRKNNPQAYKAHTMVNNYLRDGKITKDPCCVCGSNKSQAHHEDYSKPLEIIWVCAKHHHDIDK